MGAATFVKAGPADTGGTNAEFVLDNKRGIKGTLTLSNSYATGGDSLALPQTGLKELTKILIDTTNLGQLAGITLLLAGTKSAPLIQAYDLAGTQVAAAVNLSTRPVGVWLLGA